MVMELEPVTNLILFLAAKDIKSGHSPLIGK
jgi:hypothetical protein